MILFGEPLAQKINQETKKICASLKQAPGLAVVLIGHDPASQLYVSLKKKQAQKLGLKFFLYHLPANEPTKEIIKLIKKLNNDPQIQGIIVQLPLPKGYSPYQILEAIAPEKDVDCLTVANKKLIRKGQPRFVSPFIQSILAFLDQGKINPASRVAILARSSSFAKNLSSLLKQKYPSLSLTRFTKIPQPPTKLKNFDIIITALGKPQFLTPEIVAAGAFVIDGGISKKGKKVLGDADFKKLKSHCAFLTPVPKGIGPVTVSFLLLNTARAAKKLTAA